MVILHRSVYSLWWERAHLELDLRVTERGAKVRLGFKLQVGDRAAGWQP